MSLQNKTKSDAIQIYSSKSDRYMERKLLVMEKFEECPYSYNQSIALRY